jgi:BirA family transcriptional regulator, biotin operon repressor / biotin---[acetyl-CoA-carboxylase] ligase
MIPMNKHNLQKTLSGLPLGRIRYFDSVGSTNDEALAWAAQGARDLSIVIADEQSAGRGRLKRKWFTPKGTALAFSLILRPYAAEHSHPARTVGLGALALASACLKLGLHAQIKWPNDILLDRKKTAGILVESVWIGNKLDALVLGMGVNVLAASVPPVDQVLFPATSLESELGHSVDRADILCAILSALLLWRSKLGTYEFLKAWEEVLAFRGEQVQIFKDNESPLMGELLGLAPDGGLRLREANNKILTIIQFGEIHLRPAM